MKDVVTGAPFRQCVLVTGFGAFPGAPRNPTLAISPGWSATARASPGSASLCAARCCRSSTTPSSLPCARRTLTLETRAVNRASPLHPDAARRRPTQVLAPGRPHLLRATWPAPRLRAALAGQGVRLSIDAGDYVCNATLYRSLDAGLAPRIGFLHVPRPKGRRPLARGRDPRPSLATMTETVLRAIVLLARDARVASRAPLR